MDSLGYKAKIEIDQIQLENKFQNIKSYYILQKIFNNLQTKIRLNIIRFNKNMKKKLDINLNDYKEYLQIEIDLKIINNNNDNNQRFITIKEEDKKYYHLYFDGGEEEIKKYCINKDEKIENIKIIIDYQIKSFESLFENCCNIESLNFKKFYRNNINNMSFMFYNCSSLKELNLNNFNTNNVINMEGMFCYYS